MSRKKKILIILNLCFAFAYLFWLLVQPYAKEIVSQKSQTALYEMVMAREPLFQKLSPEDQIKLIEGYTAVSQKHNPRLMEKIGQLFFVETPPFALAWLFFTLVISILLLLRIEGAAPVAWLLPLIVLGYAYFFKGEPIKETLFPPESYVLERYVQSAEKESLGYRESLLLGWHRYLIKEWGNESPSDEQATFDEQLDKGLFAFNVARLKWILDGKGDEIVQAGFAPSSSLIRIAIYFIWNLFFAWIINRKERSASCAAPYKPAC